jgi:hypothetical protein
MVTEIFNFLRGFVHNGSPSLKIISFIFFTPLTALCTAQDQYTDFANYQGREYFLLRSGRAKMVIQSDKIISDPAFSYMLFDAQNPRQSRRKSGAFNYVENTKFLSSALEVIMRNHIFTAIGNNTNTDWTIENGIPSVEAIWWAGGIKVREVITPVTTDGVFSRKIILTSANMVADDTISIRLSIPDSAKLVSKNILTYERKEATLAIAVNPDYNVNIPSSDNNMVIGPIAFKKGETKIINSYIFVDIPAIPSTDLLIKCQSFERTSQSKFQAVINHWKNSNTITTKDDLVQKMYDNNRYILPGYIADDGKLDAGVFEYGGQWVRDASNTALGAIHIGEFELAHAMLEHMLLNMITDEGTTMIGSSFGDPSGEQFDQMGEFMYVMKSYVDWTGDFSLLFRYKNKIVKMIERPLNPIFRDVTGMVHNKREFWERTFDDAYEIAYQTWVIVGLRTAADLSKYLEVKDKAEYWRKEADIILNATLNHPTAKLVDNGHLIKRRNTTGEIKDVFKYYSWVEGAPGGLESLSCIYPDASMALPIAMHVIEPKSLLAKNTLNELEKLWNQRWSFGGYDRYNTSSQGDQPGPWSFATTFIMRAQHEAGLLDMSRRSLDWLYNNAGGRTGALYEEIPLIKGTYYTSGLIPWTSAEISYFIVHNMLGIKFYGDKMVINPNLYQATAPVKANLRFKTGRIDLEITNAGKVQYALVNNAKIKPDANGDIVIPKDYISGTIKIVNN